jgi:hypothetical protein
VFTYAGNPVRYVNTKGWRNALKRAGIANFRWHDLTWASWLVQNGTPLYDLQEMGGLEVGRDGAALRTSGACTDGASRCSDRCTNARHKFVTTSADYCGHKKGVTITRNAFLILPNSW